MSKKTNGSTFVRITTDTRDRLRAHCDRLGLKMGPFADNAIRAAIPELVTAAAAGGRKVRGRRR
jgi:hypothetical protein